MALFLLQHGEDYKGLCLNSINNNNNNKMMKYYVTDKNADSDVRLFLILDKHYRIKYCDYFSDKSTLRRNTDKELSLEQGW